MEFLVVIVVIAVIIIICSLYHGHIHQHSLTKYDILQEKQAEIHNRLQNQLQAMHTKQNATLDELKYQQNATARKFEEHQNDTARKFEEHHKNTIHILNQQQEVQSDKLQNINDNVSNISDSVNEQVHELGTSQGCKIDSALDQAHDLSSILEIQQANMPTVETNPNSYDFETHQRVEMEDNRVYGSTIQPYQGDCKYPYYFGSHNDYRPFVRKDLDVIEGFSNYDDDEPKGMTDPTPDDSSLGDTSAKINYHHKKAQVSLRAATASHHETKKHLDNVAQQHRELAKHIGRKDVNHRDSMHRHIDEDETPIRRNKNVRNILNMTHDEDTLTPLRSRQDRSRLYEESKAPSRHNEDMARNLNRDRVKRSRTETSSESQRSRYNLMDKLKSRGRRDYADEENY